ncbi:c-type cytochrome [Microvirga puerhi]|uniref:Cytochrome c4 n=1 Tax=Microvirga puerhi TaxID=2876078 RepID=A0ABS7VSY5_9HYPH|nr:c-type cytochrome [Microvirga puerhi]MBZ6078664.1 cytochrome c4 [Microvirga puerhi]
MSAESVFSLRNRWFITAVGITAGLFLLTAVVGLIVLPYAQRDVTFTSIWDAICSAAGVPQVRSSAAPVQPDFKVSTVVVTASMLGQPSQESIGRGATLAQQCAICHGPVGVSRADSPNLAGQYASAIYKQLKDFTSGARVNAIMTPFAVSLSEQDMVDLSAYYAYLPRLPAYHPEQGKPAPRIVVNGAPMRNIAACGSCHGALDNKAGSPWLEGQSAAYIRTQLQAFASGARRNDISQQMRNIARQMTPEEIDEVAQYYASQPPQSRRASSE